MSEQQGNLSDQQAIRIYLVSDLHVEFHGNYSLPPEPVDVVVLAGDIGTKSDILKVAKGFRERCGVPVIVVPGNHEFYGTDYVPHLALLRAEASQLNGIHFLEQSWVVIGGVRFLGCTLWSDFRLHGQQYRDECKRAALRSIADFSVIRYEGKRFTPDHAAMLFRQSYDWLEAQLAIPYDWQTVVISHFLPHTAAVHPMHAKGMDPITAYFTTACSDLMDWYPIDIWMYGHSHNSVDLLLDNGVRLVSNQRGYPQEPWPYTQFNPNKIIRLKRDPEHDAARRVETGMRLSSKEAVLAGATWLTAEAIAEQAGRKRRQTERDLQRWSDEKAIFSLYYGHQELYPDFILDPGSRFRPYPAVAEILQARRRHRSTGWQLASWFIAANGRLGGAAPKDLLVTQPEEVLEAARMDEGGPQYGE